MTNLRAILGTLRTTAAGAVLLGALAFVAIAGPGSVSAGAVAIGHASALPKVMTCAGKTVTRPSSYIITCADGYTYLSSIHWTIWSPGGARATATYTTNTCTPSCVAGKNVHYPANVSLSQARSTTSGRLFTELGVAYTAGGKLHHYHTSLPTTPLP